VKVLKVAIKLGVLAGIIGLVLAFCDLRAIFDATSRAGLIIVAAAFGLSIIVIAINAVKWHLSMPTARIAVLFRILMISYFYSFFFVGQASGEAAKMYMLSRASGHAGGAVVSVFADRWTSFIGMLLVTVIGFAFSPSKYPASLQAISVIGLAVLIALLLTLRHDAVFVLAERFATRLDRSARRWTRAVTFLRQAIEQWHIAVRDLGRVSVSSLMGMVIHIGNVLVVIILARGVGIHVNFFDWCWIVGVMSIAGMVPITVGYVTANGVMAALLQLLGVPISDAVAVAVLLIAVHLLLALVGALIAWLRWGQPRTWSARSPASGA